MLKYLKNKTNEDITTFQSNYIKENYKTTNHKFRNRKSGRTR